MEDGGAIEAESGPNTNRLGKDYSVLFFFFSILGEGKYSRSWRYRLHCQGSAFQNTVNTKTSLSSSSPPFPSVSQNWPSAQQVPWLPLRLHAQSLVVGTTRCSVISAKGLLLRASLLRNGCLPMRHTAAAAPCNCYWDYTSRQVAPQDGYSHPFNRRSTWRHCCPH